MSDVLFGLSKMDPMARKCVAAVEAMQTAIDGNNRDDVALNLAKAKNALDKLTEDLGVHDSLTKASERNIGDVQSGPMYLPINPENKFNGGEDAIGLGVVRPGRSDKLYRPHRVF